MDAAAGRVAVEVKATAEGPRDEAKEAAWGLAMAGDSAAVVPVTGLEPAVAEVVVAVVAAMAPVSS